MSVINLVNVDVRNNPAPFTAPYQFEITFECVEKLQHDLEWKLIYVGSATSSEHDQELDSLLVGPIPVGVNKFLFEADPPNLSRIPDSEIIGVTVILLTGSYDGREFVRVGYYVNNEYSDEALINEPPAKPIIDKISRNILAEKPRVTRLSIKWDSDETAPAEFPPEQPGVDGEEADGDKYGIEEEEEDDDEEEEEEGPKEKTDNDGDVEMGEGDADVEVDVAVDEGAESEDIEAETEEEDYDDDEEAGEDAGMADDSQQAQDVGSSSKTPTSASGPSTLAATPTAPVSQ